VLCPDCLAGELATKGLKAWAERERLYDRAVRRFIEAVVKRGVAERERLEHQALIDVGASDAKKRVMGASGDCWFHRSEYVKGASFKCVGCSKWRREAPVTVENENFYDIRGFREANPWLQGKKSEFVLRRYRMGAVSVCNFCAMPCPACGGPNTMQNLSVHGCCYGCNVQRRNQWMLLGQSAEQEVAAASRDGL
jgi:hypothetical protein